MFAAQILLIPFIIFIISVLFQNLFAQNEYIQFIKFYGVGLIGGIILNILLGIINGFFVGIYHPIPIAVKLFLFDGLLYTCFIAYSFYFVLDFFGDINTANTWKYTTLYSLSYILGISSITNIALSISGKIPELPTNFLSSLAMILLFALLFGYIYPEYFELKIPKDKLSGFILSMLILSLTVTLFNFTAYYNEIFQYLVFIPLLAVGRFYLKNELG